MVKQDKNKSGVSVINASGFRVVCYRWTLCLKHAENKKRAIVRMFWLTDFLKFLYQEYIFNQRWNNTAGRFWNRESSKQVILF